MESTTNTPRAATVARIGGLIHACRLEANRADLLALWNAGHFDDMDDRQLDEFLQFMDAARRCRFRRPSDAERRLRSQALSLLTRLGKYAGPDDWSQVNRFLLQRKVCGRLLYMLDEDALKALISKLRAIVDKQKAKPAPQEPVQQAIPVFVIRATTDTPVN